MNVTPVDIVLPCYNPNGSWPDELLRFHGRAKNLYAVNFILVNDGSGQDRLPGQISYLQQQGISIRYLAYEKNMGKGYALRQGVQASQSTCVVYTDVDFPFTDQSTLAVIDALLSGQHDVVAGYRDSGYYRKKMPVYRKLLSRLFRFFIGRILKMPVTDTQCGLKGFNQKGKIKFLATTINRYLFDFEFIYASVKDKALRVNTVQVELKENIVFSKMPLKIFVQELFNLGYVLLFKKH